MEATAVRPDTLPIRPILKHSPSAGTVKLMSPSSLMASRSGHTCGSLFAKCNCKTTQPIATAAKTAEQRQLAERRRTLFQSYSHPDTNFVFTDENRNPTLRTRTPRGQSTTIRTKRLSTPCIPGTYSVLNMAVHPEVVLTMSHSNGRIEPMYAEGALTAQPRPILKKSITFQGDVSALLARMEADDDRGKQQTRSVSASSQEDFDSDCDSIDSQPVNIERVNQQYRERCDSERSMTSSSPGGLDMGRKASRSLGNSCSRVDQVGVK